MALGDKAFIYQRPVFVLGGTDISAAIELAAVRWDHVVVRSKHSAGQNVQEGMVSDKYSYAVDVKFGTDGYSPGELDAIITALMPDSGPGGASTNGGRASFSLQATDIDETTGARGAVVSVARPKWSGMVLIPSWAPVGTGKIGERVEHMLTWTGVGDLVKATS